MRNCELQRRRRGWTQRQFGNLVRIGQPYISLLEQGRWAPTGPQLERIARALDLTPNDVFKLVLAECDVPDEPKEPEATEK